MLHRQVLNTGNQNTGKKIQNYIFNFNDCLGKGNFSTVYRAYHQITNEQYAIKIIQLSSLKSKKLQQLLFSQIDVLKKLNHPNVLKCYEVFTSNRHCYIITELCNQGDLQSKLRKKHTFSQREAQSIVRDVFEGLSYLADMNIVHRDLKVANIFMHSGKAKIADFGFAKFTKDKWKDINIGSPIYMSPEGFIDNIYGPKTDVWAFGIMIYQFFHGQSPFARCKSQIDLKRAIVNPLTWNSLRMDLSAQIKQVILRCLEVNEQKRCTIEQLKYSPYIRRLLSTKSQIIDLNYGIIGNIETQKLVSKSNRKLNLLEDNNGRVSDLMKPISNRDFEVNKTVNNNTSLGSNLNINAERRSKNLVQISSNRNEKVFSPLGLRLNNGLVSPTVNQSMSLQKFHMHNHQRYSAQTNNLTNVLDNQEINTLKQAKSGQIRHKIDNSIRPNRSNNNLSENYQAFLQVNNNNNKNQYNNLEEPLTPQSISNRSNFTPVVISTNLTFKQCVNILHYCRLLYKFIQSIKLCNINNNESLIKMISDFLMSTLSQVSDRIQSKGIIYDGQNVWLRQKKLRQVTDQYTKKYTKDLPPKRNSFYGGVSGSIVNLLGIRQASHGFFLQIDQKSKKDSGLILASCCGLIVWHSSRLLQQCYETKSYKNFGSYKQIEGFLNKCKNGINEITYQEYKKKLTQ